MTSAGNQSHFQSLSYPAELRELELDAIRHRRGQLSDAAQRPSDLLGLGLSGGGIRSATFNLGILQALAKSKWLRSVDFLSTVSGGGYIGSFLGRNYDRLRNDSFPVNQRISGPDRVERALASPESRQIDWLRKHGNYIAPSGQGDRRLNTAIFIRNFLSVHFVVGIAVFALFGVANGLRYGAFDYFVVLRSLAITPGDMPISHLLQAALGPFYSPWFILFEALALFLVLPRIIGYWLASQDRHERYQGPQLALLFIATVVLLYLSVDNGSVEPFILSVALLSSFIHVELAWRRGRKRERAVGTGGTETQRLRTRNYLTYDLGLALALTGVALAFAIVDTIGHGLQQWVVEENIVYAVAFTEFLAVLAVLMPAGRIAANFIAARKKREGPPSTMARIFSEQVMAVVLAVILMAVPLVFYSFTSHAVYHGGSEVIPGFWATGFAALFCCILASPRALAFVNRSSLAQTYAARLARAYLGASNPLRHRPEGANVTEVVPGDDVRSIRHYRPHEAGGPLHLINVTVNQTVDFTSQRGNRDRKGENVAVSCFGMTIGETWHSIWQNPDERIKASTSCVGAHPIGARPIVDHPLVDEAGTPTDCAEDLSLRQWISISGAAITPGRGHSTQLGTALLFGLANLRTGHWWNSGIADSAHNGFPKLSFLNRLLYLIPRVFVTQSLLIFEWTARYAGPWEKYWYLSDGGYFENLGGYELIRRRLPRMIISDGTADPMYRFSDLANFVRKSKIDFDAQIESFTQADIEKHVPASLHPFIGTLADLAPQVDRARRVLSVSKKSAALFWVRYATSPTRRSVLLYLKATVTGNEKPDVAHYHATHPEFPHESTADQCFDEGQWESYRQLGEHIATPLVSDLTWLFKIPL